MIKKSLLAILAGVVISGSANAAAVDQQSVVAKGQGIYETRCMHCHGEGADGQGELKEFLKIVPADLSRLCEGTSPDCVTDRVLKAVLGKHKAGDNNMPLLVNYLSVDQVYLLTEYIKTRQK